MKELMQETKKTDDELFDFNVMMSPKLFGSAGEVALSSTRLNGRVYNFHSNIRLVNYIVKTLMGSPVFPERMQDTLPVVKAWDEFLVLLMPKYSVTVGLTEKRWIRAVNAIEPLAEALDYDITHLSSFDPTKTVQA